MSPRERSCAVIRCALQACILGAVIPCTEGSAVPEGSSPSLCAFTFATPGSHQLSLRKAIAPARVSTSQCSMSSDARATTSLADVIVRPWTLPDGGLGNAKVDEVFRYLDSNAIKLPGQPMRYEPLNVMARVTNRPFASTPAFHLQPEDIECRPGTEDIRACYCALLQLACGGLDECHNRVTPFSWDSATMFGGPPVFDSAAQDDATYIHHLVHMREGQFPGEFGTGWNNAGFWAGSVGSHPIFPQLAQASVLIAQDSIPEIASELQQEGWSLPTFIKCCSAAVGNDDAALRNYCERVINVQYRLLADHLRSKL